MQNVENKQIPALLRAQLKRKVREKNESVEEKKFVQRARELGWLTRKMNGVGFRNWPDQLCIVSRTEWIFFEFKKVGAKPRPAQLAFFKELQNKGILVYAVDSAAGAFEIVELNRTL
jgi:hypothetical protein